VAQTARPNRVTQSVWLQNLKGQLVRNALGQTWERQSGDWRSQETYNPVKNAN